MHGVCRCTAAGRQVRGLYSRPSRPATHRLTVMMNRLHRASSSVSSLMSTDAAEAAAAAVTGNARPSSSSSGAEATHSVVISGCSLINDEPCSSPSRPDSHTCPATQPVPLRSMHAPAAHICINDNWQEAQLAHRDRAVEIVCTKTHFKI